MALDTSIETLRLHLTRLQEAVAALQVTVTEDRPSHAGAMLVDRADTLITDLASTLDEATSRMAAIATAAAPHRSVDEARQALQRVHGLLNRFTAQYMSELASHEHVAALLQMGRERGHGWPQWCAVVETAIAQCAGPLNDVARATLGCWTEIADRLANGQISMQATNIGQQITVNEEKAEMARRVS